MSRDVARVVADVSVLCPRVVDALDNRPAVPCRKGFALKRPAIDASWLPARVAFDALRVNHNDGSASSLMPQSEGCEMLS
jgi:hypothetical protein